MSKKISDKELAKLQKAWVDKIMDKHELSGNALAQKAGFGAATINTFIRVNSGNGYQKLSNNIIRKLYHFSGIKPDFPLFFELSGGDSELIAVCKDYIESCRIEKNHTSITALANAAGITVSTLTRVFSGNTKTALKPKSLEKLEKYSGLPVPEALVRVDVFDTPKLETTGSVNFAIGDIVELKKTPFAAPMPASAIDPNKGKAIKVENSGNIPFIGAGSFLYYTKVKSGVANHCIGNTCLVKIKDGKTCIKIVGLSHEAGKHTIRSLMSSDTSTAKLEWATPILWIKQLKSKSN
nr:hypothetical protein 37 [bacterium]